MKYYLHVPIWKKDHAKALGAKFDTNLKAWYTENKESESYNEYFNSMLPQDYFKQDLLEYGILNSDDVKCDGVAHRIRMRDDSTTQQSGFYWFKWSDRPFGYFFNNRTQQEFKHDYSFLLQINNLTDDDQQSNVIQNLEKTKNEYISREKSELTDNEKRELNLKKLNKLIQTINQSPNTLQQSSKYFERKRIWNSPYCYSLKNGTTLIPFFDINGNLQTCQFIASNGEKRLAKNCPKTGAYHVIRSGNKISSNTILVCEGYATGASLQMMYMDFDVVSCIDCHNLIEVTKNLRNKYPHAHIIICADNDLNNNIGNVGLTCGLEARDLYDCDLVFPELPENYNPNIDRVTISDFNDLANLEPKFVNEILSMVL